MIEMRHLKNVVIFIQTILGFVLSAKVALHFFEMGDGDYCAVYGCSNDRRKPEKDTVMDHVGKLRWYSPKDQKDILKWQKLLNIGGDFKVSMSRIPLLMVIDLISALFQPFV